MDGLIDKYKGCLLGLAVGDALGTTLEFAGPGAFTPITDMVGGGPFGLEAGQWTDDTSMALCLAESLIEKNGFDAADQMERYCKWWRDGHLSSKASCFDIGNTVRNALSLFEKTGNPFCGSKDPMTGGNGSLMRLAPVPMFFNRDVISAIQIARDSSATTHGSAEALDACGLYCALICGALQGIEKEKLLSDSYWSGMQPGTHLSPKILEVSNGSYKRKNPPQIKGTGYVVQSLEAALWAFYRSGNFREGALLAVNLGDDADTTGAIYGQLAGAYYGIDGIPDNWVSRLFKRDLIEDYAVEIYERS